MLTENEWHQRFAQQARWTQDLRHYFYAQNHIQKHHRILDVGCGSGVICDELSKKTQAHIFGIDILPQRALATRNLSPLVNSTCANGLKLPFPASAFDLTICHYLLLWIKDPFSALQEMKRVTRPNGMIAAFAEPDYTARIDYPPPLEQLGNQQTLALQKQGADTQIGRKLKSLFNSIGLVDTTTGILGGNWQGAPNSAALESEWQVIRSDLSGTCSQKELEMFQNADNQAWQSGNRLLFVPTFYAWGKVID